MLAYPSPHKIIDHIINVLFEAEHRRLTKAVNDLCTANREAYGEQLHGFHYQGRFFRYEGVTGALKRKVLHFTLFDQMDLFLKDEAAIKLDEQMIRQTLFQLLDPCKSQQDIRDALPNCLTDTVNQLAGTGQLMRQNDEAFTIRDNPRAMKQYWKVKPKLELYSAARLLY